MFEMQAGDQVRLVGSGAEFAIVIRICPGEMFICEFPRLGFKCQRALPDVTEVQRDGETVYESELFASIDAAAASASRAFCRRYTEETLEARRVYIQ